MNNHSNQKKSIDKKRNGSEKNITDMLAPDAITQLKEKIIEKFSDHTLAILKFDRKKDDEKDNQETTEEKKATEQLVVVMDDSDSTKLSKQELQEKIDTILKEITLATNTNTEPHIECISLLTSSIIQECKDNSYNILQEIMSATILYDTGILEALKAMWIHKELVVKKLDKYVVAYVVAGSIVKGIANPKSDIDSYIIVDDTDVKRMSRMELQDKLRAIIYDLARTVESESQLSRKIHPQVWLLTDYWEGLKEANPVMITMLRDCIPLYDKGTFMPWKNLLDMGRIKPSDESIKLYMESGEQMYRRANDKLLEIVMEDLCLGILYPSQALMMLAGEQPPAPKEAVEKMRSTFVDKYHVLDESDIDTLSRAIALRKAIEYGDIKQIDGVQLQLSLVEGRKYLDKIKEAFKTMDEKRKEKVSS